MLAVTHDRYFLDNVAEWICEVDRGHLYPYKGNYSTYLETKAARLEAQGQQRGQARQAHERELEWVRRVPKARQAKSKARLERYEQMDAEARARRRSTSPTSTSPWSRVGQQGAYCPSPAASPWDRVLIDDLSFELPRNGIVGIIGPNGVAKTTLFKTIVGLEPLSAGELDIGETVKIAYVDQNRAGIDPDKTLWEVVSDGLDIMQVGETEVPSRAYVAALVSRARTSRSPPACSPVASATASTSRLRSSRAATCSCSTSRPMTWIPRRWRVSRKPCSRFPGLRGHHEPRPLVPRQDRNAYPRLGGHRGESWRMVLVRGQL